VRRWWILLPVALCGGLLWLVLDGDDAGARAVGPREWVTEQGDRVRILEGGPGDHVRGRPKRAVPAVLTGVVYDPYGRPVEKAEVEVLLPKPYRLHLSSGNGRYEIEFVHPGEYLLQAALTVDLAPQRKRVVVPAEGQPDPVDFRLRQAGLVFGEVVVGQRPVTKGFVDIEVGDLFGDWEYEVETTIENGFFSIPREPPRDVPLRAKVVSPDGFLEEPVRFRYEGERVDLGTLVLTRYPTLLVRLRLPDGTWADEVFAGEGIGPARRTLLGPRSDGLPDPISVDSHVRLDAPEDRTMRLAIWAGPRGRYRVVREVHLARGQLRELEITMRAGPTAVRRRLTDGRGDPIRARLRLGARPALESGPDGFFDATLPWSGVHTLHVEELFVPDVGWVNLVTRLYAAPSFLVDADDPAAPCVLPFEGRVLLVAAPGTAVALGEPGGSSLAFGLGDEQRTRPFGALLGPFDFDELRLVRAGPKRTSGPGQTWRDWTYPDRGGVRVVLDKDDLTVVDAR